MHLIKNELNKNTNIIVSDVIQNRVFITFYNFLKKIYEVVWIFVRTAKQKVIQNEHKHEQHQTAVFQTIFTDCNTESELGLYNTK